VGHASLPFHGCTEETIIGATTFCLTQGAPPTKSAKKYLHYLQKRITIDRIYWIFLLLGNVKFGCFESDYIMHHYYPFDT